MGQYFKPCVLKRHFEYHKEDAVISSLSAWDYMCGAKLMEHSYVGNVFVDAAMKLIAKHNGQPFVWCGDYADEYFTKNGVECNAYRLARENSTDIYIDLTHRENYKYIVNYTKREYIEVPDYSEEKWVVHPLPLLCAAGNGNGGGDYSSKAINADKVGIWAYNRIGVTNTRPHYKKIDIKFEDIF